MPPAVLPLVKLVGDPTCIAAGDQISEGLQPDQTDDGFPRACYVPDVPLDPFFHHAASIWQCEVQKFYARAIQLVYTGDAGPVELYARRFFGPGTIAVYHDGTDSLPALLTVRTPNFSACIVSGTDNFQQLALQAFYAIRGPQSFGPFSTNPQWYTCSEWIKSALDDDGIDPIAPIIFAGHSYGAAGALILIARYRFADPLRRIRYLTYGCPKPGDARLSNLLSLAQGISIANTGDYVTILPPGPLILNPVYYGLGLPILLFWTEWDFAPSIVLMQLNGRYEVNEYPIIDTATMLDYTLTALADGNIEELFTHPITQYIDRIARRCPGEAFPAAGSVGLQSGIAALGKIGLRAAPALAAGQLGLVAGDVGRGRLGIAFNVPPGQLGLGAQSPGADMLGLGAAQIAAGELGIAFNGIPGQLGLGGAAQIAAGELGIAFNGIPGQLGLGGIDLALAGQLGLVAGDVAAGQLGLVAGDVAAGQLGLVAGDVGRGKLGIAFNGIPGQLGLGAESPGADMLGLADNRLSALPGSLGLVAGEVAAGQLGLGSSASAAGQLGLADNRLSALPGSLGLVAGEVAAGQLGLGSSSAAAGTIGLYGNTTRPGVAQGAIGLFGPISYRIRDTYDVSDQTNNGRSPTPINVPGNAYSNTGGTMSVVSQTLQATVLSGGGYNTEIDNGQRATDIKIDSFFSSAGGSNYQEFDLLFRWVDSSNFTYFAIFKNHPTAGTGMAIAQISLGAGIFIAGPTSITVPLDTITQFHITDDGTNMACSWGTNTLTAASIVNNGATKIRIGGGSTAIYGSYFDDFRVI